ncbi:ATP-binding Cassette (ABC) Superfamily, partial [Thraustotheca clavata]
MALYTVVNTPKDDDNVEEERHPLETSGFFSFALMLWLDKLIHKGAKTPLQEHDIWPLPDADASTALSARFAAEWEKEIVKENPQFHHALYRTMARKIWCTLALYYLYSLMMLLQPIVIKSMLQYLQHIPTELGIDSGFGLAAILTVLSFIAVTCIDFGQLLANNLGCNAKCIVMDVVYQKSLKISAYASRTMSSGQIVTLSSVDSDRLFDGFLIGPWTPTAPVSLFAIFIMIGFEMGYVVAIVGCLFMYLVLLLGFISAKQVGQTRRDILSVQSERVKLTNEVLQGVRVVKMYGWEKPIEDEVARIRAQELIFLKQYQGRRVFNTALLSVAPVMCLALCLVIYVAQGNTLTADTAFTVLAYMNVARLPCYNFSNGILFLQEAKASCDRYGAYLLSDEVKNTDSVILPGTQSELEINQGDFSWHSSPSTAHDPTLPMTLKNINLSVQPNSLTIIVGAVGSGKSSLIGAILGEIHQVQGTRDVRGNIAYVSQESWIQHDSLRNNILFSSPYEDAKYRQVLDACQLTSDLKMLPDGDATEIGERGINLSGGQKARVSLARAMYRTESDIYLLDDPLSALDVHVAGAVFRDCVQGMLKDKMAVLVLNSHYHFLPHADRVIVMVDGEIAGDGSYDVIKEQFPHLHSFSETETDIVVVPAVTVDLSDDDTKKPGKKGNTGLVAAEDRNIGAVAASTYSLYIQSSQWNVYFVVVSIFIVFSISQAVLAMLDWFMGYWSTHADLEARLMSAWIYCGIAAFSILLIWGRCAYVLMIVITCSKSLHEHLFKKVLWAPVNTFFDLTPVGRILNRFSSDLDQVDSQLPFYGLLVLQFGFQILAVTVVCAATSPFILILYVPLFYLFYKLQAYYNISSGDMKRFDSVTRSPVVNLISETIDGLATIRAFGMTRVFSKRSRVALDYNQRFFMTYRIATRWLQMRLDWLSAAIIAGVSFLAV